MWSRICKHITLVKSIAFVGGIVGIVLPETGWLNPTVARIVFVIGVIAIIVLIILVLRKERVIRTEQKIYAEIREALFRLHSELSNIAEKIAETISKKRIENVYKNLVALYQLQGKMQNLGVKEDSKDVRKMLEKALKSLNLKSAYDIESLKFILNMAWSMKDQDIILESVKDKIEYDELNNLLEKQRAQVPSANEKVDTCLKYSRGFNNWYVLSLYAHKHKEQLPVDIRISIVAYKEQMDEFMHALIAKVRE